MLVRVLVCEGPWSMTRQNFYSFSFNLRLRLVRFLTMLRYDLYIALVKKFHFASSTIAQRFSYIYVRGSSLLQEIIRNYKYDI